jgi:hypothetical protein
MKLLPASPTEDLNIFQRIDIANAINAHIKTLTDFVLSFDLFKGFGTLEFSNDPKFADLAGKLATFIGKMAGFAVDPTGAREFALDPKTRAEREAILKLMADLSNKN